jgi:NADH-quinone oxidoreductase subunit H
MPHLILFLPLVFIVFFACSLAEANRVPFDLPEAESELVAGFMTEFSSLFFSLIVLLEYSHLIILFFCGSFYFLLANNIFLLIAVVFFLILLATSAHAIFPRFRYDLLLSSF